MTNMQQADSSDRGGRPGKVRTIWHPLLVRLLTVTLGSAFKVEQEISVGKMPLQVDILLIRREGGELSEADARDLAELLPLLHRFSLVEFKAPTDALERGDFAHFWAALISGMASRASRSGMRRSRCWSWRRT